MSETASLNLKINKCPLSCDDCKKVYINKETGLQIICECCCHKEKSSGDLD